MHAVKIFTLCVTFLLIFIALVSSVYAIGLISVSEVKINNVSVTEEENITLVAGETVNIEMGYTSNSNIEETRIKVFIEGGTKPVPVNSTNVFNLAEGHNYLQDFSLELNDNMVTGEYLLVIEFKPKNEESQEIVIPVYIEGVTPLGIVINAPTSPVKGDFTFLIVETNRDATCKYSLDKIVSYNTESLSIITSSEMSLTGELNHLQTITDLEEFSYRIVVICIDKQGVEGFKEILFDVDLSEVNIFLLRENIGNYKYKMSSSINPEIFDEEVLSSYLAYYDKSDDEHIYAVMVSVMETDSLNQALSEIRSNASLVELIDKDVYVYDTFARGNFTESKAKIIVWKHEDNLIYVIVYYYDSFIELPLSLIESYLEKYPSDLDTALSPPVIELIYPEESYIKRISKPPYEIDFEFKVGNESDINECNLIINGEIEETTSNIKKNTESKFSVDLDRGNYDWRIECVDEDGNKGISEIRELTIKRKSSSSSSFDSSGVLYDNQFQIKEVKNKNEFSYPESNVLLNSKEIRLGESKKNLESSEVIIQGFGNNLIDNIFIVVLIFCIILFLIVILITLLRL